MVLALRKNLQDRKDNELSKLFHLDIKGTVKDLISKLAGIPQPAKAELEHLNSRIFTEIRDELLSYECDNYYTTAKIKAVFDFFILLYDSDEYYRHRIDWVIQQMKIKELEESNAPEPEYWKKQ